MTACSNVRPLLDWLARLTLVFMNTCMFILLQVSLTNYSQVNKIMEESVRMKHFDHHNVLHLIGVPLTQVQLPMW